ncbi:MAG: magnesium transporter [Nitrospina sp.]|nr:magnesium transporter [Nitrospina sp.]
MSDSLDLTHEYLGRYPAEAAPVLEGMDSDDAAAFLSETPAPLASSVMDQMLPWVVAECIQQMEASPAAERLRLLSSFRAFRVLLLIPEKTRNDLMVLLPRRQQRDLRRQMDFPSNTVGAWMDTFAPTLPDTSTVEEALAYARRLRKHWNHYLCLMSRDGAFRGMVSLSSIISAPNNKPLYYLVDPEVRALSSQATLLSVRFHASWDRASALPVVNAQSRIVGLLNQEQLREGLGTARTTTPVETGWATGLMPLITTAAMAWTQSLISLALGEKDGDEDDDPPGER